MNICLFRFDTVKKGSNLAYKRLLRPTLCYDIAKGLKRPILAYFGYIWAYIHIYGYDEVNACNLGVWVLFVRSTILSK